MRLKTALVIACNILGDELDRMETDNVYYDIQNDPYYKEISEALSVIKEVIREVLE